MVTNLGWGLEEEVPEVAGRRERDEQYWEVVSWAYHKDDGSCSVGRLLVPLLGSLPPCSLRVSSFSGGWLDSQAGRNLSSLPNWSPAVTPVNSFVLRTCCAPGYQRSPFQVFRLRACSLELGRCGWILCARLPAWRLWHWMNHILSLIPPCRPQKRG